MGKRWIGAGISDFGPGGPKPSFFGFLISVKFLKFFNSFGNDFGALFTIINSHSFGIEGMSSDSFASLLKLTTTIETFDSSNTLKTRIERELVWL